MSELDAFEAKVRQNIKQLSSPDPKRRHQAATWLGEAGDPSAITRLRQIYEEDHDPKVRAAAAYSLGMFRALEEGLAGPNQEKIVVQLEDIALKGKIGRRTRISVPFLRKLLVGLIVSALILLAFNFLIWPEIKDQISVSGLLGNRGTTASSGNDADVSGYLNALQSDVEALRSQYLNILGGGAIDCAIDFNMPTPLDASSQSGMAEVIDGLNQVRRDFDSAREPFDRACNQDNPTTLTAADMSAPLTTLVSASEQLAALGASLSQENPAADTGSPTDVPVEATPEPTPAEDDIRPIAVELLGLIDDMTTPRGPAALINTYWEDIRDSGQTDGCSAAQPTIPSDYALPEGTTVENQTLELVIELVNTGLGLTRQGWTQFNTACNSSNPLDFVEAGLQSARSALVSFELARDQLNTLIGS